MLTRKLPQMRVQFTPYLKLWIALMALGLSRPGVAHSTVGHSDKSQLADLKFAQESFYQASSTDKQNPPATQEDNLNPAIWDDEDDTFTLEESEGNVKFAHQSNHSEAVTPVELLASLFTKAWQFHRPHIYLITTCLRI